tara:strand:+ start:206 stop:814 length:609 start_codon:yes stop_codon:yes gene_type:complete
MSLRAQILPNIFNEKYIKSISKRKKKKNFLITYIGNSNEQKRLIFFFKIITQLNKLSKINFEFNIIGNHQKIRKKFKKFNYKNINFIPFTKDVFFHLKESNLMVAPSVNEGFGRTIIEANLLKILVLASDSGAHTEIVQNGVNGFIAKTDSVESFVEKIIFIVTNYKGDLINKIINYAYENSSERYKSDLLIKKYKKVIYES